jgi:hypothetical protein
MASRRGHGATDFSAFEIPHIDFSDEYCRHSHDCASRGAGAAHPTGQAA